MFFCDQDCQGKWNSINKTGENNSNWNGGYNVYYSYPDEFNLKLRTIVRERDGFKCQFCGDIEEDRKFNCHHIDYDKTNTSFYNLITLCQTCHGWSNSKRDFWYKYYSKLINGKYRNKEINYG